MKSHDRSYTPPPMPIYRAGKRKEKVTKAITLLNSLLADELEAHPDIVKALEVLKGYRKSLEEI